MKNQHTRSGGWNRLSAAGLHELSELVRGGGLFAVGRVGGWSTALSGLLVAAFSSGALAGPEGSHVVRGDVNITRNGSETLIRAGRNSIINYRSFDIARGETVRFLQPDAASRVLNRITGANPTRIDGNLLANGRVYIVNPAGVYFSGTARVDVARLYAASSNLSNDDFVRGVDRFTGSQGPVVNEGTITANFVSLLGKSVTNGGTINAPQGTVVMAAGDDILIGERTGNVFVKVSGAAAEATGAAVTNTGTINAAKGRVSMAAGDMYSMAIRAGGKVKAKTVRIEGQGTGEVRVDGAIDASNAQGRGGDVRVLGEKVVLEGAAIDASGSAGGGKVLVGGEFQGKGVERRATETTIDASSDIRADATGKGDGGTVVVWSDHQTDFAGSIHAVGGAQGGDGGSVEVSGKQDLMYGGEVRVGAVKGRGGSLLLDPQNITVATGGAATIGQVDTFGTNANTDRTVSPATLDGVGGAVTLQANNNITVTNAISLTTANASLTMQAGNSIILNANVSTTNGAITLIANDVTAGAGTVVAANRADGTSLITFATGVTLNAGSANVSITMNTGAGRTVAASASGNIALGNVTTTGHALVRNVGPTAASGISRVEATSLVTASSAAFDVSGAGGGGAVGAVASPIRTAATNVEALGGTGGVFLDNPGAGGVTYGGANLGGLTGVSALGAGNVSIASGGATTISEAVGSVSGDVGITSTGALTLNAAVSTDFAAGSDITASAAGISGTGTFAGNSLTLSGTGTFTLSNANNVVTLASATTGALTYNDTNGFSVGGAGISSGGNAISLSTTAGGFDIAQPVNAGAGTLTLNAASGVSGNAGAITAGTLTFGGGTAYTLTNSSNNVGNIGGTTTGAISYRDADALTVTGLSSTGTNITLNTTGLLTVTGALNAGVGNVSLTAAGVTESGAGAITAADLALAGTGTFALGGSNDVDTFAAVTTGGVTFSDTDGFSLSATGISTSGNTIALTATTGTLTLGQAVNAGAGSVTLTTDDIAISAAVTGNGGITIRNQTSNLTIGVGDTAPGTLSINATEMGLLASTGTVTIGRADLPGGQLTTDAIDLSAETYSLSLIGGNGAAVTVGGITMPSAKTLSLQSFGTMAINGAISAPGASTVALNSAGAVTQTVGGTITANAVTLAGAGTYTLTSNNNAATLSGTGTGGVSFTDLLGLSVGALSSGGNNITLNTTGLLTLTGAVVAGAGDVGITAAGVTESGGTVSGDNLSLAGTGTFAMGGANDVTTFEAGTTGLITYNDANGFTIAGTGINTAGNNATLSTTAGGVAINQPINVGAATLSLTFAGGATQGGSGQITANTVTLAGAGTYTLTNTSNDADTLTGTGTGGVSFTDLDSLSVGALSSGGNNITLNVTGLLTLTGAVTAGAGDVSLTAAGVTETGGTVAGDNLSLSGSGTFAMGGANDVATFEAGTTGAITYNDANGFTVSGTGITTGGNAATLSTTAGGAAISQPINVGAGDLTLNIAGSTTQSAAITAAGLRLLGGAYTLTNTSNAITTLAANTGNALSVTDSNGFTVGTVGVTTGITTSNDNVTLTAVSTGLTLNQAISIGTGTLTLNTPGAVTQGASGIITADTLDIRGAAAYTLDNDANNVANLAAGGGAVGGNVTYHDADSFNLGAMTVSGGTLTLRAASGTVTQSGILSTTNVLLTGPAAYTLNQANTITTLAADNTGAVSFTDADGFTVGSVGAIDGIVTTGNASVDLTSSTGTLAVTEVITVGSGSVSLTTDVIDIAAVITGNGGITIQNVTAGQTIGLAGGAGGLNLSQTELDNLASTGTVTIGRSSGAASGALTANTLALGAEDYNLTLIGGPISAAGITLNTGKTLTLNALTGGANVTGTVIAQNLLLLGTGAFSATDSNNDVTTLAANTTGSVDVRDLNTIAVGAVGATNGVTTGGNQFTLTAPDGITVSQAVNTGASSVSFTANDMDLSSSVTGNGGITLRPSTGGTAINLGTGAGGLNLSQTELNNLASTGTVTIGDASTSGVLTTGNLALGAESFNLELIGTNLAIGGVTLNSSGLLTLNAVSGGAGQTGAIVADGLRLLGTGSFLLADATNDVGNLAGSVDGAVTYADANTVNVTTLTDVGLASNNNAIDITAPTGITVSQPLNAGTSTVQLTANAAAINALVTGTAAITVRNSSAGTVINLANGGGGLQLSQAELDNLSTSGTLTIGRTDVAPGALTTGAVALGSTNYDLTLIGDSLALGGVTINSARTLTLNALTSGATQSGALTAGTLDVRGAGFFDLGSLTNDFTAISGAFNGGLNFSDANSITTAGTGINSSGGGVTLRAPSGLTIASGSPLDAGAGIVTLAADAMAIDDNVTGNGGIFALPFSDGTTIGVGGAAGTLNLDAAELSRFVTTTVLTIGRPDAGALTADPLNLVTQGYSLDLEGATVTTNGIILASGRTLTLAADETNGALNGVVVNGAIVAPGGFTSTTGGGRNLFASSVTTSGGVISVTGPAQISGSGSFDTTNANASPAGADINFSDVLNGTTADTDSVTFAAGTTGDVTLDGGIGAVRFNAFNVSNADQVALPALHAAAGGISVTANSITLSGGADTTLGGNIVLNGAVNATGGSGLDAGAGAITLGPASSLNVNALNYVLTAAEIDLPTGAASVTGSAGSILTLQPNAAGAAIRLGDTADSGAGVLDLTDSDLASLAASLGSINIGRTDGTHAITVLSSAFRSATTIRTPLAGGSISVDGQLTGENASSDLTLDGSGATTTLNADIVTAGADITISDTVILGTGLAGNIAHLDTTNAGAVPAGANVGITGTVSAAVDGVQGLAVSSGTGGVVTLGGTVGPSGARVGSLAINSAASAALPAINAGAGGVSLTGGTFTLANGVSTTSGGSFLVNNTGLLTINTTALSLDGAFTQNALASGNVSLGTDVTTTNDSVTFTRPVAMTAGVNIGTGAGAGDVSFGSTIDGVFPLTITAGTGAVNFGGRVGNPTAIGALTVASSGAITVAGGTAPTIHAATVDFTSSGLVTINGTVLNRGGVQSDGALNITAGSLVQDGNLSGSTVQVSTSGSMLVNGDVSAQVGGVIVLHAGTSGTGDLTFGASAPILTADNITLWAGDGAGGLGTTGTIDALTNQVDFIGATLGAPSPATITIRSDADLSTADNLPPGSSFADMTGMNYTIRSDDGGITISDAGPVNATNLTLLAATGINITTAINPNTLNITGNTTISGDIITNGTLCFNNGVTLAAPVTLSSGTGTLFIKGAFNSGSFNLTLRGAEVEIDPAGSLTGSAGLTIEPDAAGKNVVLGAATSDASAGLDLSADELGRITNGYNSLTFGRLDGSGILSVASAITLNDPTTLRMNAVGGSIAVNAPLTGAGNGSFTFNTPITSFNSGVTTAGGSVLVIGPLNMGAVTVATGGGSFSVGGTTTLTGDATVNTADGAVLFVGAVDGDATANNRALTINAGTGTATFNTATGATGRLGALNSTASTTSVVSVRTSGSQFYTGNVQTGGDLASQVAGDISISGALAITADVILSTAGGGGDDIFIGGVSDSVTGFGEKSLTLNAGSGNVTLQGDAGPTNGLSTFAATGAAIATRSVRTTGNQTFTGPATVTGSIASGGNVSFTGTSNVTGAVAGNQLTFAGNSVVGGAVTGTGNVFFGGTSNIGGNADGVALTFNGDSTIGGAATGTSNVFFGGTSTIAGNVSSGGTLIFTGNTALGGNVTSVGAQTYSAGATFGTGAGGAVAINGTTIAIAGPVILERTTVFTGTGDVSFAGTILSAVGDAGGNGLTVNTPGITTFGGSVGGFIGQELSSLSTDAAGTNRLNAPVFNTLGDQVYGGSATLGSDTTLSSTNGGVNFQGTLDSADATARAITVNSGGTVGNTIFAAPIGGTNPLSTITTNANGTTFLPASVRTNGAQTYLDDVRLTADTTLDVLTAGGITFGARVDSDASTPRALTLNSAGAGETRLGGAIGSQSVLATLNTNADGALFIGGDISTNGAQTYGESATTLTGDAVLSANGITFPGSIVSEGSPRALTLAGGAGGVSVTGDIGVGSNLASLTASGTNVSLRAVQTTGDQTYSGNLTIVGNTTGSAFTSNGPAVITGNINGSVINFAQTLTLAGNVTSFASGGSVTFGNVLLLAANSIVSATNGTVLFGGTVNSSDATARSLSVTNTGTTTFTSAVGSTRTLSTLTTDAGGTTIFNGGNLALTGAATFGDAVVLGADTTFNVASLTFGSTLDSDATARNVIVRTGSTGNTEFRGNVGSASRLNRLLVNDQGAVVTGRSTRFGGNVSLTRGMVVGDPVVLIGDSTIDAGNNPTDSTLFFRSTIDADSELNNRALTLLSGAVPNISANTTSTDIVPVGSTRNVTPFRFAGNIGARSGQRLGSLTLGGDLSGAPPLAATAVFAPFDQAGVIPSNNNMFIPASATNWSINTGSGGFTMGQLNKLTAFGNLRINVQPGGTARLGDLVATADLRVVADQIVLRTRQAGQLYDDEFLPTETNPKLDSDSGLDFVSNGVLAFKNNTGGDSTITRESTSRAAFFANSSGIVDVLPGAGLIFAQFQGGVTVQLFNHNTTSLLPLDLKTQASDANVATSLAGAIPRDRREREVAEAVLLSSSFGKPLANLNINIKELTDSALSQFLIGRSFYQDVPLLLNPTGSDFKVTINRLSSEPVLAVIRASCDLFYTDGAAAYENILNPTGTPAQAERDPELRAAVQESWDVYAETPGDHTGPGFRSWLESRGTDATESEKLALEALNKAKILLARVDEIGLSPREEEVVRNTIIQKIGGRDIPELESAIEGSPIASK